MISSHQLNKADCQSVGLKNKTQVFTACSKHTSLAKIKYSLEVKRQKDISWK